MPTSGRWISSAALRPNAPSGTRRTRTRADLATEGMALEPNEAALFDLFREEAVPPSLATQITLKLMEHFDVETQTEKADDA